MKLPDLPASELERQLRPHDPDAPDTRAGEILDGFTGLAAAATGIPIAPPPSFDADRSELRASQERLAVALEASGLGLWEYEPRAGALYLTAGWMRLIRSDGPDRVMPLKELLHHLPPDELARLWDAGRKLLAGEIPRLSVEHRIFAADGSLVWCLTEAQVMQRAADGQPRKLVGTSKDITERRQADAELRRALEAADQASRAKTEFLATMSHEIRTPLNGVIGLTQLLADAPLPPMEKDSVAMIASCARSLLSLVNNILDFSRIEAGRLTLDVVPTDLVLLVRDVSDLFSVQAAEKGIRFDLRHEADVPRWIAADPARLRQILLNLLGNALKYTAKGGFSLHVRAEGAGAARLLCFQVFDTGIGIAQADQARLFTRFTQVGAATGRTQAGSGLGLAISRQLAQLMGGDIALASLAGRGSTFTLRIPLHEARAPAAPPATAAHAVPSGVRILLAEDNEVNQLVAQRLLARLGYTEVTPVFTGRAAVDACTRQAFDLVLMDCQMPVMDGWEAARALRAMGIEVPILALTASATAGDRERCLGCGMNDFMTKPVEVEVLAQKLGRWLARAAAPPPPPAAAALGAAGTAFDEAVLQAHFDDDGAFFAEARSVFLRQTGEALAGLAAAGEPFDAAAARRVMHRIRGSAAMVGARWLAAVCRRAEEAEAAPRDAFAGWIEEAGRALEAFVQRSAPRVPAGETPSAR